MQTKKDKIVNKTFLALGGHHIYQTQYVERSKMTWMYERINYSQLKETDNHNC